MLEIDLSHSEVKDCTTNMQDYELCLFSSRTLVDVKDLNFN